MWTVPFQDGEPDPDALRRMDPPENEVPVALPQDRASWADGEGQPSSSAWTLRGSRPTGRASPCPRMASGASMTCRPAT